MSDAQTRKKWAKKHSLHRVNEHFEPVFDEVSASTKDFEQILTSIVIDGYHVADHDKIKIGQQCLLFKSHGLYDVTLDFLQNRNE
ncbi:hypothetical protein CCS41_13060 [Candidatus Fukatsuia symbiotica]|uniref:Uncharacterized protein n=1 Tax=Candidatus Fukatsuia symbiotica TaxID=1878942 RepID=A0A2U8I7Q6_9GAMM|nr:hypothetical protein CCS41_13060 [Candidatus Fukatsuia symbiotica]